MWERKSDFRNEMKIRFLIFGLLIFCFLSLGPVYGGPMISSLLFPGTERSPGISRFGEPRKIQTSTGRTIYLIADLFQPASEAKGLVLYFHGNGELVEDLDYLIPFFRRAKLNALLIEYPGYGNAPGKPSEKEIYQTALSAYDWAQKEFPTLPKIAMGWSLGSTVAAYVALEREVAYLFLLSAMTSMKETAQNLFPGVPDLLLKGNEFDVTRLFPKLKAPVTIIHGTEDDLVPIRMARTLKSLLGGRGRLIEIQGALHNDLYLRGKGEIENELRRIAEAIDSVNKPRDGKGRREGSSE